MEFDRLWFLLLLLLFLVPRMRACRENEFFSFWFMNWQTCDEPEAVLQYLIYEPGCYCQTGFFLDKKVRECRLLEDCSRRNERFLSVIPGDGRNYTEVSAANEEEVVSCPENEEFMCGCGRSCRTRHEKCVVCQNGCHCSLGYVRDHNKTCIPMKECPEQQPTRIIRRFLLIR
ncbi:PREDICTED: inducible metalloproteinase inhibitor protein-like [Nicrophorus vespilloides]|uniref:Inducible metalloproteinase inhibitor protein-like n=1 Tax=Nicrophorus vespilloides TaxID=110193 RepID=A0ABM1NJN2_NICVS|nr:PREDICTED: inducible metalloproteinase inhibitor protein-like [Nicrophorus vespilloides]